MHVTITRHEALTGEKLDDVALVKNDYIQPLKTRPFFIFFLFSCSMEGF